MNMKYLIVLFACVLERASGVINRLNESDYDRLPPLYLLDDFYPCLRSPGDLYCFVDAKLTANTSSELLHIIEEYSLNNITHYDRRYIHWGLCVKKTCQQHLNNKDLDTSLEACINSSLYQNHGLQSHLVKDKVYCTEFEERISIDTADIVVAVLFVTVIALNVMGSLYDFLCTARGSIVENFLLCFSVKRNWKRLIAPSGEGPEPRLRRLKMFNGIKSFTTFFVIMGHSPLTAVAVTNYPRFIETTYYDLTFHVFYNGNIIVQSFFIVSGFLLAFNILIAEEKTKITWNKFPAFVGLRWLRLTPPYAALLLIITTWLRHFGNGPLWKPIVGTEIEACRRDWYYHILYLNDYVDHSQCLGHTWLSIHLFWEFQWIIQGTIETARKEKNRGRHGYLAADMQLTILSLLIFCLVKSQRERKIAIGILLAVGVIAPAAETYFRNLHGILLTTPEVARNYFVEDPTFNYLYKRGHTNIVCYAMGLGLGMWIYNLIQNDFDVNKYKNYRYLYWAVFPMGLLLILSGAIFYVDNVHIPLWAQAIYSPLAKMMFGMMGFILTPGTIFKLENVYRGILEWRGWAVFGRVSYCAYLIHETIIRFSAANHTSLIHTNFFQLLLTYFGLLVTVFAVALPFWMFIEAPFGHLVKLCFYSAEKKEPEANRNGALSAAALPVLVINKESDLNGSFMPKTVH